MFFLGSRLFLLFLLAADWAGDPYFGRSPLSRPFSSQDAFCHSLVHRVVLQKASSEDCIELYPFQQPQEPWILPSHPLPWPGGETEQVFLTATERLHALMPLQC